MRDERSGWVEPDITVNGRRLTFAEAMTVRVALGSFRLFLSEPLNVEMLGESLVAGYDRHLANVEAAMREMAR